MLFLLSVCVIRLSLRRLVALIDFLRSDLMLRYCCVVRITSSGGDSSPSMAQIVKVNLLFLYIAFYEPLLLLGSVSYSL